jgi:hypothetical protein
LRGGFWDKSAKLNEFAREIADKASEFCAPGAKIAFVRAKFTSFARRGSARPGNCRAALTSGRAQWIEFTFILMGFCTAQNWWAD